MDFNHPFAGMTVRYDGEIIKVRKATPDEIHPREAAAAAMAVAAEAAATTVVATADAAAAEAVRA